MRMALTGHRPERLGYSKNLTSQEWYEIAKWLKDKIIELGVTDAYCGMADGCDMVYALAVYLAKDEYPVTLHCILPCKEYQSSHSLYKFIKEQADEWIELSEEFYKGCDNVRDQYMIDHSDKLFAIWDGNKSGGVWSTIRKAQKKGIDIIYYPKELL